MKSEGEELREELITWIMEDNDFFYFIMWCFGTGIRQTLDEMEKGSDDEIVQTFKRFYNKLDIKKFTSILH